MFKSYFLVAWRNLVKNKTFSLINITGLALGMACSLLIMLWVKDEYSIDSFHAHDAQLYSVYERQYHDGIIDGGFYTPGLLAQEMKLNLPEVEMASMFGWEDLVTFEANNKILKQIGNHASPDFFSMFSYPLIHGDAANALKSPDDIAISRKMAEDFFGSTTEAFGKTIRYENRKDFKIAAVFENIPGNSEEKFDYIISWETFLESNAWARIWDNNGPRTFLMLREGTDVAAFEKKIVKFIDNYHKDENFRVELGITKYSDVYLHSNFKNGEIVGGRIQYVRLFSVVGVFILLIACINFMNLTSARSVKRSKEIGVRKVVGAVRGSLIRQFIGEAMLIAGCAFVLALVLIYVTLPAFNLATGKQLVLPVTQLSFWASLVLLAIVTGLISGSYPALYLSSFNPVSVLKGSLKFGTGAIWMRKGLVVFQFALSIILIVGTIVVSRQVNYIQSMNLGYDKENLIYIPLEGDLIKKYDVFKEKALNAPGVSTVTCITQSPTSIDNTTGGVVWEGKDPNSSLQFAQVAIGYDFMKTMKIEMLEGREFSKDFASDSVGYIVNEAALKIFNYKDPVGMPLTFWSRPGKIVGVVKDFHFTSLHKEIEPMVLRLGEHAGWGWVLIRTEQGKTKEAIASIEALTKELNPQFPFTYQFSDEEYQKLYRSEEVISKLSNGFAFLGIFISCLGLLGLAMFTAEQRTREIGIRKVLGAGMMSLFALLSKELLLLVLAGLAIAVPVSWYFMTDWLKDYAYKVDLAWWVFAAAGSMAIVIALATISFQTIKALFANPVKSLRTE